MKNHLKSKDIKRISGIILTTSLLAGNVSPIFANDNTLKDEVIYVKLNNSGKVDNVYIVNSFDIKNGEKLVDYGNYSNVVNLSTNDILNYSNGLLDTNISNIDRKFYYQGDMSSTQIPWDININYILNGTNINPEELAGKSGDLEVTFEISRNENINKVFFDNYALQISLNLDGDKCKDIVADGGSIASVGNDKTITFIKLAGQDGKYSIKSTVENFEMDSISFNGINMGMDVDIDISEMTEPLDELVNAVSKLNDGASDLNKGLNSAKDGVNELYKGSSQLESGVALYKNGVAEFDKGITTLQGGVSSYKLGINSLYTNSKQLLEGSKSLNNGLKAYEEGINTLNKGTQDLESGLSKLQQGSLQYKQSINQYADTVNKMVSQLSQLEGLPEEQVQQLQALVVASQNLASAYENIDSGINSSYGGAKLISSGSGELASNIGAITKGSDELYTGIGAFVEGSKQLVSGIYEIENGTNGLKTGSSELVNGISEIQTGALGLKNGTSSLVSGVNQLGEGSNLLKSGTNTLNNETLKLPKNIDEKIDEITSQYTNGDFDVVSFASEDNTNIESVQFAIRTDAIKIKEQVVKEEVKEVKTTLWDKFINLFKKASN